MNTAIKTIDEYIAGFPKETQVLLQKMRSIISKAAPKATETISYGIPTFVLEKNSHTQKNIYYGLLYVRILYI